MRSLLWLLKDSSRSAKAYRESRQESNSETQKSSCLQMSKRPVWRAPSDALVARGVCEFPQVSLVHMLGSVRTLLAYITR